MKFPQQQNNWANQISAEHVRVFLCLVALVNFEKRTGQQVVSTVFWKDHWAFCDFEFSRSPLINIHEKIGTRGKSPDNWILWLIEVWLYYIFVLLNVMVVNVNVYSIASWTVEKVYQPLLH